MLVTNYSYINKVLGRNHSGITNPRRVGKPEVMRNFFCQDDITNIDFIKQDAFPSCSYQPYAYILSEKGGLISATTTLYQLNDITLANLAGGLNGESTWVGTSTLTGELGALAFLISTINGSSTLSGDILGSVNISSTLAGSGDLTGSLGALVDILATINGSGTISADIAGALSAAANLAGSGDLVGSIKGVVSILSNIAGTSTLTSSIIGSWSMLTTIVGSSALAADITALAHLNSSLSGSGTIVLTSGAVTGDMSCTITSSSELSPENLAAAVWNALAASFNTVGTMGEKMNDAGSASNPWTEIIEGGYTAGQLLQLLTAVAAGKTTIVDLGGGLATVTFRNISDTTDTVVADMTDSERTNVTLTL